MLKKIIIGTVIVVVLAVAIIFIIPWGEYESNIEKSNLEETIDYNNEEVNSSPSLDTLLGTYYTSTKDGVAEILFHTDGLKTTKGGFTEFEITFEVPEDFKQSTLSVKIVTESLNTGNSTRDEHLREEGFFHVEKYPEINFISSSVEMGDTSYVAKGELTLNGTTKSLDVPFLHLGSGGETTAKFEAFQGSFEIDRTAYGQDEETGVGNIVKVNFYCELKLQQ
ncbi:YceI family protein [Paracrocinitomix mangrovi]|uniref:YceI family protein n=1 Tax=Paracrocinitomix mangrovi TaxID=2862509 RepID=UPI001C8D5B69|nr:YceI family protein [Paracrocinitomix mangrovi]UKN00481.1 YceI family protein [Paracrocinitomix mangrovi]